MVVELESKNKGKGMIVFTNVLWGILRGFGAIFSIPAYLHTSAVHPTIRQS